jgi:biopolymer transport protein ExbD
LSLNRSGGLDVSLPAAQTSQPRSAEGAVTLTITAEGAIAWDKTPVSLDEFIARLEAYKQTATHPSILLNGDENALFSQARYVIDEVRKAGIRKILVESRIRASGN